MSKGLCAHVCVCIRVCVNLCISLYVSVCVYICVSVYVAVYVYVSVCFCVPVSLCVCVCLYVSLCVCVCVSVCVSMCVSLCLCVGLGILMEWKVRDRAGLEPPLCLGRSWSWDLGGFPNKGQGDASSCSHRPRLAPCSRRDLHFSSSKAGAHLLLTALGA